MNKIVFITGASSGFGEACARKFAAAGGYHIIITGRRKERLEKLKSELEQAARPATPPPPGAEPVRVMPLEFDVQDREAVFSAVSNLPEAWKKIELLVNNAGLALGRDFFQDAVLDDWETMIDTNVKGLLYVSKAVLPLLIAQKKGHIINIGSTAGKEVYEKGNVYCATKHAVDAISKAMRIDLLSEGIKVTAIHPGAADTEFSRVRFKGDEQQAEKVYEGYTPLSAEDVAEVVYYCASLPSHVCINDLTLTCTAQANSFYLYKKA
ncbi:MAG: SDR family NAD(P)-dependent oxidoreductase [Puia sp.]|nr:SDR family NAD(P)-dependent oxidoreductase [Puia sp.]